MATVAADSFTDTASTLLPAHTMNSGGPWVRIGVSSNLCITDANRMRNQGTGAGQATATGVPATADYEVSININQQTSTGQCGVMGRFVDGNNYYLANRTTTAWQLYRVVAGSFTLLAAAVTAALVSDDKLTLRMVGDQISLLVNDVVTIGPVTNTAFTSVGLAGVRWDSAATNSTGFHGDNFLVADMVSALAAVPKPIRLGRQSKRNAIRLGLRG